MERLGEPECTEFGGEKVSMQWKEVSWFFHTMETYFGKVSRQWKRVSGGFPRNGKRFCGGFPRWGKVAGGAAWAVCAKSAKCARDERIGSRLWRSRGEP